MNYTKKSQKGFTLAESVIAITLIIIGIVGVLNLVNRSAGFANIASNRLIAANLGQEAIEIVRNVRDSNWVNQKNWNAELIGFCDGVFQLDYNQGLKCDTNSFLLFDEESGYNYSEGRETIYKRKVEITEINNSELRVKAIVSWQTRGGDFEIVVEDHLYNWF